MRPRLRMAPFQATSIIPITDSTLARCWSALLEVSCSITADARRFCLPSNFGIGLDAVNWPRIVEKKVACDGVCDGVCCEYEDSAFNMALSEPPAFLFHLIYIAYTTLPATSTGSWKTPSSVS